MSTQSYFSTPPSPETLASVSVPDYPLAGIPELHFPARKGALIPDDADCEKLWDKYEMLDNVRAHSRVVADVATELARHAFMLGLPVCIEEVRASGLLHDLAKTYCLRHGGGHAQLGASWVVQETHNYAIAHGVFHHVYWPWPLPADNAERMCSLPFFIMYADKRARHDQFVTLEERFDDLYVRYGNTETHRAGIRASYLQAKAIEAALSRHLCVDLSGIRPD
ncbi:MAG: HD domain-containing protein [Desulfovibrionaceae bacterium]|nr:HD domain-containing protein [Desulfovibrionaceae bacterium]